MTDSQLIKLFLPIIQQGLIDGGFNDVMLIQNFQPTIQGIYNQPTVFYQKVSSRLYGYMGRKDQWVTDQMVHTESQWMESIWRVGALVSLNPSKPDQYTASDLVQEVAYILQSNNTVVTLLNSGVNILRITDILNPYFLNDKDQYYAFPNFNFTLTYEVIRESESPVVTYPIELEMYRV